MQKSSAPDFAISKRSAAHASRWDSFAVLFVLASVVETKTILALESSPDLFEVMR